MLYGDKTRKEQRQSHLDYIDSRKILERLCKHALGELETMKVTEIRAAEVVLRKVLPDLKVTELTTDPQAPPVYRVIRSKAD